MFIKYAVSSGEVYVNVNQINTALVTEDRVQLVMSGRLRPIYIYRSQGNDYYRVRKLLGDLLARSPLYENKS